MRRGTTGGEGEIIQVQGGHIVRSTGRKDRHSKVYTAKGPRDRRVRLSAHTAIQFYDVQDRLGYDRPSKAVDWLIKKAKSAIDKLDELPPWHPTGTDNHNPNLDTNQNGGGPTEVTIAAQSESSGYSFHQLHHPSNDSTSFVAAAAAPIDHDSLPDNMKSFFPTSSTTSSMNFQSNYPSHDQMVSRNSNHTTEDLGLSLHSLQHQDLGHTPSTDHHQTLFQGSGQVGYESNFQRMMSWGGNDTSGENRGGFVFNPPAVLSPHHPMLAQGSSAFSQRGPLQSSFVQSIRAWHDLPMASSTADHHRAQEIHQSFFFGSRFAPDHGLAAGYSIPARIHGEEEESVVSDRPSSSSPNSQH